MSGKNLLRSALAGLFALLLMSSGAYADTAKAMKMSDEPAKSAPAKTADVPKQKEKTASEKRADARANLEAAAKKAGLDSARLKKFCDELEARTATYSVKDEQVTDAYKSVEELISTSAKNPFCDQKERNKLAEETLHNIGRPMEIDQGSHPTCNVTTLEVYIAARHPDVYAKMVQQVAVDRKYKTAFGETVDLPKEALMPGVDEKAFDIDHANKDLRNRASQFVEMTLVNGVYETGRFKRLGTPEHQDYRYIMGPQTTHQEWDPQWGQVTVFDTEDKMIDGQGNTVLDQNGNKLDSPGFTTDEILAASDMVLGFKMPYVNAPYQIQGQPWVYDLPDAKRLLDLKKNGKLPLGVPTKGGIHVQTIHDVFVDGNGQCWVLIDNQHGEKDDGWVTLQELHANQQSTTHKMKPQKAHP
jgi:hypothetical protein